MLAFTENIQHLKCFSGQLFLSFLTKLTSSQSSARKYAYEKNLFHFIVLFYVIRKKWLIVTDLTLTFPSAYIFYTTLPEDTCNRM